MRRVAQKILHILDGTPAVYGKSQRGQSIVEMTVITPLLIILIAGIVEIGWLANNYLTLQEVTKVGARRGTVLTGDLSPLAWESNTTLRLASILPASMTGGSSIAYDPLPDGSHPLDGDRTLVRSCNRSAVPDFYFGFYNLIICQMLDSLDPLEFRLNGVDDIVVSVFAIQVVNNRPVADGGDFNLSGFVPAIDRREYQPGFIPVVVGRYPSTANECNILMDGTPVEVERDPFDFINDSGLTVDGGTGLPLELAVQVNSAWVSPWYDDAFTRPERQRGFSWRGQHRVDPIVVTTGSGTTQTFEVDCYGSDWSIYEVQELMSVPGFAMSPEEYDAIRDSDPNFGRDPNDPLVDEDLGHYLPNQGMVLVEMFWQHELLLNLPVFSPVLEALGSRNTTISVWSAFPVPSVEPNIEFQP